ncbi:MAG: dihydrolipoyl dehydrogenase [Candidatus Omnitrophica bacterium]|nr:dihydrolipoyl dehydrogenase [Candidatus Omnitrophota bacterium]
MKSYDLAIIGAGWAGFNAALRADGLGLKVVLIEEEEIGGTCLNRGCIPTKFLVHSAKLFSQAKKANQFGIAISQSQINLAEAKQKKDILVKTLRDNLLNLLRSRKAIDFIKARAKLISRNEISLGDEKITSKFILIASGSRPKELGDLKFDSEKVLSSTEILNLENLPKNILIIGGGVIGCEFASLFSNLETEVLIVEFMDRLLPQEDVEISRKIETIFKKRKINVMTKTDARNLDWKSFDKVLLCIGRDPYTSEMGLQDIGIKLEKTRIVTDEYMRTDIENIYAAGDCTSPKQLAHLATHQAILAVENMVNSNNPHTFNINVIPSCIFTDPEIASIGLDESSARKQNLKIIIDRFDFLGSGMARIINETEGFIKIVSDKDTEKILGAAMIGPRVTELIAIFSVAIKQGLTRRELAEVIFAHPTLSEGIGEALHKGLYGF